MEIGIGSLDGNGNDVGRNLGIEWDMGMGGNANLEPIPAHVYSEVTRKIKQLKVGEAHAP